MYTYGLYFFCYVRSVLHLLQTLFPVQSIHGQRRSEEANLAFGEAVNEGATCVFVAGIGLVCCVSAIFSFTLMHEPGRFVNFEGK